MTSAPRILIVEDQFCVAIDCELNLRACGFDCVGLASTADEAVELATREHPDLVLMDIRLDAGTDGVGAAIEIYERLGIRCIFCSGHADAKIRQSAQSAHPLGWLEKPYTSEGLIEAVRTGLAHQPHSSQPHASGSAAA